MNNALWAIVIGALFGVLSLYFAQTCFPYSRFGRGLVWLTGIVLTVMTVNGALIA